MTDIIIWFICEQDDTIVKANEHCKDCTPKNGGKPNCEHCQHALETSQGILELLDTRRFKFPTVCKKPCLFRSLMNYCCLDLVSHEGHTDENCEYGIRRQAELCLTGRTK